MQNKTNRNELVPIKNLLGAYKTQIKFIEKYYDEKIGGSKPFRIVFDKGNGSYHSPYTNTVVISLPQMEKLRESEPTLIHAMFYTMLMHEIGHALHTSTNTREYIYHNRYNLFRLQNIVEDNRMEEKVAETNEAVRFDQLQFALIDMSFRKQAVDLRNTDTLALMLYRTFNKKEFAKKLSINEAATEIIKELYELEKKYKNTNNSDENAVSKICSDIYDKLKKLGKIVNDEVKKQYEAQQKQKQQKQEEQEKQEEDQNADIFKAGVPQEEKETNDTDSENNDDDDTDEVDDDTDDSNSDDNNDSENDDDTDEVDDEDDADDTDEVDEDESDEDTDAGDDAGDTDEDGDPSDDTDDTDAEVESETEDSDSENEPDETVTNGGNESEEEVERPKDIQEFLEKVVEEVLDEMPQEKISELLQTLEEAEKKENEAFDTVGVIETIENTTVKEQPYTRVKIPVFDTVKHKGIKGRDSLSRPAGSIKELSLKRYARREHVLNEKVFDRQLSDIRNKETANVTFYLDFSGSMFSGSRNDKANAVIDYMKSFYDTLNKYVNITLYAFSNTTKRITRNELQYPFLKAAFSGNTNPYFQKIKRNEIVVVLTDGQFSYNAPKYILEKAHIIFLKDTPYTQIPSAIRGARNLIPVLLNDLNAGFNKATASLKRVLEEK